MASEKIFYAYPNAPKEIGQTIEEATKTSPQIQTWKVLDVYGHFISEEVLKGINESNIFMADISRAKIRYSLTSRLQQKCSLGKFVRSDFSIKGCCRSFFP